MVAVPEASPARSSGSHVDDDPADLLVRLEVALGPDDSPSGDVPAITGLSEPAAGEPVVAGSGARPRPRRVVGDFLRYVAAVSQ